MMDGETKRGGRSRPRSAPGGSGGDELVPALDHVTVFVHERVPTRDVTHALPEGAAVAHPTGLLHDVAVRILDHLLRRLALVPVVPLVLGHELLRGLGHRG